MVLDKIENAHLYSNLNSRIAEGINYIKSTNLVALAPGKYEVSEGVNAIISEYASKNEQDCIPEAHLKYIDIQYIIKGEEIIGYTPLKEQKPSVPYNKEKDLVFYDVPVSHTKLETGMFAIYFPDDIHMPGMKSGTCDLVKKLVVKILV